MTKFRLAYGLLTLCIAVTGGGAVTAERAASIEYEFVVRPADVPAEYDMPAGTGLRFLSIKAIDGSRVDAALWQPGDWPVNVTTMVISVHGSGGTLHGNPNGFLAKGLAAKGYGVLGINTRQSGNRVNTDSFLDHDLESLHAYQ